jgi:hypothetical protein
MTAFVIAVVVGSLVAIVYVFLAGAQIGRVRERVLAGGREIDDPSVYDGQGRGFTVKATLGALASVLLLVGVSAGPGFWYVLPFLAIGSSIAVIVAFLTDTEA